MPTTQASPAVGATRPLRRRAATGGGGTSHQTQSSKRVRAKLMPLPSYRKRIFSECCQGQALRRASATLTEIEYPLLVKRVFSHPPRHRGYAAKPPTATAADASRLCRPRRRRRPSGRRGYAGALRRGGRDFTPGALASDGEGKRDLLRDRIHQTQPSPSRQDGPMRVGPTTQTRALRRGGEGFSHQTCLQEN